MINSINNLIYQAISSLETGLLSTPPERLGFSHATNGSTIPDTDEDGNVVYPEAKLEIENGLHQLETLLESTVDKAFDKFEIVVLRNSFRVDEELLGWIRLKHYEVRTLPPTMLNVIRSLLTNFSRRTSRYVLPRMRRPQRQLSPSGGSCKRPRNSTAR